ncbi:MAG: hypothetical protein A3G34_14305 [Candidatus Lindowbacteria bacterium RIFCSPLOWO2_12_FULL_62_27]|nr:MAG: hypothetical protein A3G34_14305 [Candidatus Lindowbacteria bacterium RIFCSPLOWO2_12_FULL_62_27]
MPRLTMVVTTRNRVQFLSRFLAYYAGRAFSHPIIISDASDPEPFEAIVSMIRRYRDQLNVTHLAHPRASANICLAQGLAQARTPYCMLASDDDFYVPETMDLCMDFLDRHPAYRVAHGLCLMFGLDSGQTHGRFQWMTHYEYADIEDDTGAGRLGRFMSHWFATGNSIHRTEDVRDGYTRVIERKLGYEFAEILTTCIPVIRGKVKRLEKLYKLCQAHPGQVSARGSQEPGLFEWFCAAPWRGECEGVQRCLAEELARQDGMSVREGEETAKKYLWWMLGKYLSREWDRFYAPHRFNGFRASSRETLRRMLGRLKSAHRMLSFIPTDAVELSLNDLARPTSVYHDDFAPVCEAVTRPVEATVP